MTDLNLYNFLLGIDILYKKLVLAVTWERKFTVEC